MLTIKRLLISGLFLGSLVSSAYALAGPAVPADTCPTPADTCAPACDSTCNYYVLTNHEAVEQSNTIPYYPSYAVGTCENKFLIEPSMPVDRLPFNVKHTWKTYVAATLTGPPCLPVSAPVFLSSSSTCDSITVSWQAVSGATYYKVFLNTGVSLQVTGTSYTFISLDYNKQYTVYLQACSSTGCTPQSARNITTSNDISCYSTPANPTLNLSSTATTITASWPAVAEVNTYYVGIGSANIATSGLSNTFSGLTPDTSYNIYLKACVVSGTGSKCSSVVVGTIKTLASCTSGVSGPGGYYLRNTKCAPNCYCTLGDWYINLSFTWTNLANKKNTIAYLYVDRATGTFVAEGAVVNGANWSGSQAGVSICSATRPTDWKYKWLVVSDCNPGVWSSEFTAQFYWDD